jgi:hypothetical protein
MRVGVSAQGVRGVSVCWTPRPNETYGTYRTYVIAPAEFNRPPHDHELSTGS